MTKLLDEVYASNPTDKIPYFTLEFNHSAFRDDSGNPVSIRLVKKKGYRGITARLEDTAPFNPGENVSFDPSAIAIKPPEKGIKGRQEMSITIDAANGEIIQQLERVVAANREPIKVIYRVFVSSDMTSPQGNPIEMTVLNPSVNASRMTCRAVFSDVLNKSFPSLIYTAKKFPGLV